MSKDFAKEIMVKYGVPTAAYGTFPTLRKLAISKSRERHRGQGRRLGSARRGRGGRIVEQAVAQLTICLDNKLAKRRTKTN